MDMGEAILWVLAIISVYLMIGGGVAVIVSQSPYATVPVWQVVLLWPLFVIYG